MIMQPQLKDAVIVQQAWQLGPFADMLRLTYQRHAAYAWAHGMEYWTIAGCLKPEMWPGGWGKIWILQQMLQIGYQHVFWIDTDAAITDMECDLRDGISNGALISACEHWAPHWFPKHDIPKHFNVGVLFLKNDPRTVEFLADWIGRYPGDKRWMEQGSFNDMIAEDKYKDIFCPLEAKWNSTYNVNEVANPCIMGWHGIMPEIKRFAMMKEVLKDDFLKFRV